MMRHSTVMFTMTAFLIAFWALLFVGCVYTVRYIYTTVIVQDSTVSPDVTGIEGAKGL